MCPERDCEVFSLEFVVCRVVDPERAEFELLGLGRVEDGLVEHSESEDFSR